MTVSDALERGWSIIPAGLDKHPRISTWKPYQERKPTEREITAWAAMHPPAWAVITGRVSGLVTLDFDGAAGVRTLEVLKLKAHRRTPSGGFHVDFRHPGWAVPTLNGKSKRVLGEKWPGLDIRGDGGYALFTGKTDKGQYTWIQETEPYPLDILPLDLREFLGLLRAPQPPSQPTGNGAGDHHRYAGDHLRGDRVDADRLIGRALDQVRTDGRNNSGFWLCQQLRDNHYSESESESLMRAYAARCPSTNTKGQREPYGENEIRATVREVFSRPAREPWGRKEITQYGSAHAQPAGNHDAPAPGVQKVAMVVETGTDTTNVDEIATEITKHDHFARDVGGRLYVFRDGVYRPTGESFIRARVKALYGTWRLASKWTMHKANEVVGYIQVDCPELWTDPPVNTINVLNGLVDVRTRKLRPHTYEFYSAVQLPVSFDPAAKCPAWEQFIVEVFPQDSEAIAWEIPAWLMTPENSIQKAILLLGEGSNGKSTFLRACIAFIGKCNTAALSLHKLEQDKFAAARLIGKLANICPDLPTAHLSTTSMFKALTGGDVVSAEWKFKDSFEYLPFCKLIFSANKPPQSDDATHGFFRRWQVVPFARCFEDGAKGTVTREELDARLADPNELSGVLNKALLALSNIRKQGFTQSESMREAWDEFRTATDPLSVWLDQNTVLLPNAMVPKADLVAAFNRHCTDAGRAPMTKTAFGLALKRIRNGITEAQRTWQGREKTWVYTGIGMRAEDRSES